MSYFDSISLKLVPKGRINDEPVLIQILEWPLAWLLADDNPLPESLMA